MTLTTNRDATTAHSWAEDVKLSITAAIHEAGHAVACVIAGREFDKVSIRRDVAGWTGSVDPVPGTLVHAHEFMIEALILLAGATAQVEFLERTTDEPRDDIIGFVADCSRHDLDQVASLGINQLAAEIHAVGLVRNFWPAIVRLAQAITEAPGMTLSYDEVLDVLGPRLGRAGTRAHLRHFDQAARDYATGPRLTTACGLVDEPATDQLLAA